MTLALIVWLVMTVLPAINIIGFVVFVSAVIITIVASINILADSDPTAWRWISKKFIWIVPVVLFSMMTPSKETAWYMIGAYAGQTLVQSETGQAIASDSADVLKSLVRKSKEYVESIDAGKTPEVIAPGKK